MRKTILGLTFIFMCMFTFTMTTEGESEAFKDDIKVSVTTDNGKILNIQVLEMNDTKRIAEPAIKKLTEEIIKKQSVDIDNISGATYTSLGFKEAVKNALNKSKIKNK